jgi:hypothetical protein
MTDRLPSADPQLDDRATGPTDAEWAEWGEEQQGAWLIEQLEVPPEQPVPQLTPAEATARMAKLMAPDVRARLADQLEEQFGSAVDAGRLLQQTEAVIAHELVELTAVRPHSVDLASGVRLVASERRGRARQPRAAATSRRRGSRRGSSRAGPSSDSEGEPGEPRPGAEPGCMDRGSKPSVRRRTRGTGAA